MTDYLQFAVDAVSGVPIIGAAVNAAYGLANGEYDGSSQGDGGADASAAYLNGALTTQFTNYLAQLQAMSNEDIEYYSEQYNVDFNQLSNLRKQLINLYTEITKTGVISDKAREMANKIENAKVQQVTGSQRVALSKAQKDWQRDYELAQKHSLELTEQAGNVEGTIQDLQDLSSRPVTKENDKIASQLEKNTGINITVDKVSQKTEKKKTQETKA